MVETVNPWIKPAGDRVLIATATAAVVVPYEDLPAIINGLTKLLQEWQDGQPAAKPRKMTP